MEYKELVKGVKIPVLGMGTWKIGGGMFSDRSQDKVVIKALRDGIKLGMMHIDTAEIYGNGHSEEIVGKAIKPFKRKELFITTKVSPQNLRFDDLVNSIKGSLKRLKLKYVDLYLVHWPNSRIPIKETVEALEYVVEQGFTGFIGVSNFSVALMEEAKSYLIKQEIVANQVEYNLLHRKPEDGLLSYCQKEKIMLIAYTPLAKGKLARPGFKILDKISEKYNKTQAQVALNWLIAKKGVVAIPKAIKIEHLKDNVGAVGWELSKEDMKELNKEFSRPFISFSSLLSYFFS